MKSCIHDTITYLVYHGMIYNSFKGGNSRACLDRRNYGRSLSDGVLLHKKSPFVSTVNDSGICDNRFDHLVVKSKKSLFNVYFGGDCNVVQARRKIVTRWANPFKIWKGATREDVILRYRGWVLLQPTLVADIKKELRGNILGCSLQDCRGHTLAEIANFDVESTINVVSDEEDEFEEDDRIIGVMNALQTLLNEFRACLSDVMASQRGRINSRNCNLIWCEGIRSSFQKNE